MSFITVNVTDGDMTEDSKLGANISCTSANQDPPKQVDTKGCYVKFGILGYDGYVVKVSATASKTATCTMPVIKKDKVIWQPLKSKFGITYPTPTTTPPPPSSRILATYTENGSPVSSKGWTTDTESGYTDSSGHVIVTAAEVAYLAIEGVMISSFTEDETVTIDINDEGE